jgi:hypothetical protein
MRHKIKTPKEKRFVEWEYEDDEIDDWDEAFLGHEEAEKD